MVSTEVSAEALLLTAAAVVREVLIATVMSVALTVGQVAVEGLFGR